MAFFTHTHMHTKYIQNRCISISILYILCIIYCLRRLCINSITLQVRWSRNHFIWKFHEPEKKITIEIEFRSSFEMYDASAWECTANVIFLRLKANFTTITFTIDIISVDVEKKENARFYANSCFYWSLFSSSISQTKFDLSIGWLVFFVMEIHWCFVCVCAKQTKMKLLMYIHQRRSARPLYAVDINFDSNETLLDRDIAFESALYHFMSLFSSHFGLVPLHRINKIDIW